MMMIGCMLTFLYFILGIFFSYEKKYIDNIKLNLDDMSKMVKVE
jgi:hypothetical protein